MARYRRKLPWMPVDKFWFSIHRDYFAEDWPTDGVLVASRADYTHKMMMTISVWTRITKQLGLSLKPNRIGFAKLSKYFETMPEAEWEIMKLESALEGMK